MLYPLSYEGRGQGPKVVRRHDLSAGPSSGSILVRPGREGEAVPSG